MEKNVRRDPMANYNMLSAEQQKVIDDAAKMVFDALGGEKVELRMVLGFAEAMNPVMKIARNNSGECQKKLFGAGSAKTLDDDASAKIAKYIRVGDKISYLLKSKGIVFENVRVNKVSDKRLHVEITEETQAIYAGERVSACQLPDVKLGVKYVAFNAVQFINGVDVYEFIQLKNKAASGFPKAVKVTA